MMEFEQILKELKNECNSDDLSQCTINAINVKPTFTEKDLNKIYEILKPPKIKYHINNLIEKDKIIIIDVKEASENGMYIPREWKEFDKIINCNAITYKEIKRLLT